MTVYQMVKALFYDWLRQLDTISACEKQTSRHLTIAKTAITQRRAGEKTDCVEINRRRKRVVYIGADSAAATGNFVPI